MRILSVVGARPNFMKLAPVDRELAKRPGVEHLIVHTGQHYDPEMSAAFFEVGVGRGDPQLLEERRRHLRVVGLARVHDEGPDAWPPGPPTGHPRPLPANLAPAHGR